MFKRERMRFSIDDILGKNNGGNIHDYDRSNDDNNINSDDKNTSKFFLIICVNLVPQFYETIILGTS